MALRGHGTTDPSFIKRPAYHGGLLASFAVVAAALLSVMDIATREPIARQAEAELQGAMSGVVPARLRETAMTANPVVLEDGPRGGPVVVYRALAAGQWSAFALVIEAEGYAGPIQLLIGLDPRGTILGTHLLAHRETPGLGDQIEPARSDWLAALPGKRLGDPPPAQWAVDKDGGSFDSISGATVTPRTIIAALRETLVWFEQARITLLAAPVEAAEQTGSGPDESKSTR